MNEVFLIESTNVANDKEMIKLFNEAIEEFEKYKNDEFMLEARVNPSGDFLKQMDSALANSAELTKKVLTSYDDTTTGLGRVFKSVANVVIGMANIIARCITFIFNIAANILSAIGTAIEWIQNLPDNIRNKIRGNINLYITANDLEFFHQTLFPDIKGFIGLAKSLTEGNVWGTFWNPDKDNDNRNDMEIDKKMRQFFKRINVDFVKSLIDLSLEANRNAYFGNGANISYADAKGDSVTTNYPEALKNLIEKIQSLFPELKEIRKAFNEKLSRTEVNGKLAELPVKKQLMIRSNVIMIAEVAKIISKFMGYANKDLGVIISAMKRIRRKYNIEG